MLVMIMMRSLKLLVSVTMCLTFARTGTIEPMASQNPRRCKNRSVILWKRPRSRVDGWSSACIPGLTGPDGSWSAGRSFHGPMKPFYIWPAHSSAFNSVTDLIWFPNKLFVGACAGHEHPRRVLRQCAVHNGCSVQKPACGSALHDLWEL